jgi:hypothetical protein
MHENQEVNQMGFRRGPKTARSSRLGATLLTFEGLALDSLRMRQYGLADNLRAAGEALMGGASGLMGAVAAMSIISSAAAAFAQETRQLSLPNVNVTAPAPPLEPPYLRDPGAYQRNPYNGRYRVEEDKFREVPCSATRIASAAGGKCLQGYRLIPAQTQQVVNPKGGDNCDLALDVVVYSAGNLSIEADTLIFDPYKLTAIGHQTSQFCYVSGNTGYDQEDFRDNEPSDAARHQLAQSRW